MIDHSQAQHLIGQNLYTTGGDKIGTIDQVYVDDYHDAPEWVMVKTGSFGTKESLVPLVEANVSGDDVVVPYTRDQIKNAPNISDSSHVSEAEEQDLYRHYDITWGATPDEAMTGSQERLDVGTEQVESGRARLRKWIKTENLCRRG